MKFTEVTFDELNTDQSGVRSGKFSKVTGFYRVPVVTFGNVQYAILWHDTPHPGHNTAEVINVTEFNESGNFQVAVTQAQQRKHTDGFAWVVIGEGISLLTIYTPDGSLYEYTNPSTAVLSYRIAPPTSDDIRHVADELDEQLQENGIAWGL